MKRTLLVGVLGWVLVGSLFQPSAYAGINPRGWVQGGVNVVAGAVKAVDEVAEGIWDVVHGSVLHPLGIWGKGIVDGLVSIGAPPA